jgi:DNA-directed RNA polymerase subunit RPC12/RpoP
MLDRAPNGEPAAAGGTPPNRTMLAEPERMVRYTCPRCKKSLESPASFAGQKLNCPDCNQRIQVPQPSTPAPVAPVNKTILAEEVPAATAAPPPAPPPPPPAPIVPTLKAVVKSDDEEPPSRRSERRESCLECGIDITDRARVQTCPDCGSLFCSAACFRDHNKNAHDTKKKSRRRDDDDDDRDRDRHPRRVEECRNCGTSRRPITTTAISDGGWITFVLLLIFFFPLCWIGLLMTETRVKCSECGSRIS